ncbi:MAG: GNAT family N-acetyltransferase [Saprospiraceae bacterium]
MIVRPYQLSDKEPLIGIFNLNTPTYFDPVEVRDYEGYLDLYGDTYFTIEHDQKIVGGMGYIIRENEHSASITWIFFHPDYKGLGLGSFAVNHCLTIFKSRQDIETLTIRTSQLVYPFFEKFGYRLIHSEKNYWGQGLDLCVMEMLNKPDGTQ